MQEHKPKWKCIISKDTDINERTLWKLINDNGYKEALSKQYAVFCQSMCCNDLAAVIKNNKKMLLAEKAVKQNTEKSVLFPNK